MIEINISKQLRFADGNKPLTIAVQLPEGNIIGIYGNSGAGKTTLLQIVAGLMMPDEGYLSVNNAVWLDTKQGINLPPQQRSIGYVFQDYALFPNMTVLQNLHFAAGKNRDAEWIHFLIHTAALSELVQAKPAQLSGGQQQRAALIRALVRKPRLLLLDEPLSALDSAMRRSLRTALQQLQQELQFTALLVSHDVGEIYTMASQVIELRNGSVAFQGTPAQLFKSTNLSSKLQLTAEVLSIIPNGVIYIVELLVASKLVKITATAEEVAEIAVGDPVLIYTKAFHLGMKKIV